jgi:hypothetical protein
METNYVCTNFLEPHTTKKPPPHGGYFGRHKHFSSGWALQVESKDDGQIYTVRDSISHIRLAILFAMLGWWGHYRYASCILNNVKSGPNAGEQLKTSYRLVSIAPLTKMAHQYQTKNLHYGPYVQICPT